MRSTTRAGDIVSVAEVLVVKGQVGDKGSTHGRSEAEQLGRGGKANRQEKRFWSASVCDGGSMRGSRDP